MLLELFCLFCVNINLGIAVVTAADILIPLTRSPTGKLSAQIRLMNRGVFASAVPFELDTTNSPFVVDILSDDDDEPTRLLLEGLCEYSPCSVVLEITNPFERLLLDEGQALSIGFGTDFARQVGIVLLESNRMIIRPSNLPTYVSGGSIPRANVLNVFSRTPHHVYTRVSLDGVTESTLAALGCMRPRHPFNAEQRSLLFGPRHMTPHSVFPLDLNFGEFMTNLIPIREFLVIQNTIEMNGGRLVREGGVLFLLSHFPISQLMRTLPSVRYTISSDPEGEETVAEFVFSPEDYIGSVYRDGHRGHFFFEYARNPPNTDTASVLSLTSSLLQHVGLLFDYDNNQIGFFDLD